MCEFAAPLAGWDLPGWPVTSEHQEELRQTPKNKYSTRVKAKPIERQNTGTTIILTRDSTGPTRLIKHQNEWARLRSTGHRMQSRASDVGLVHSHTEGNRRHARDNRHPMHEGLRRAGVASSFVSRENPAEGNLRHTPTGGAPALACQKCGPGPHLPGGAQSDHGLTANLGAIRAIIPATHSVQHTNKQDCKRVSTPGDKKVKQRDTEQQQT